MNDQIAVDDYMNELSDVRKERALVISNYIRVHYPEAKEMILYKIPMYELNNTYIGFASQKTYLSIYCHERRIIKYFSEQIPKISTGKGCVRFRDKDDFDVEVVKKAIDKAFTEKNICYLCKKKPCDGCQL